MSATDVIAVVALAVSIGAGVAAIVSLILGFRESSRRDEEVRLLREEAGRRDEELSILRQQVAAEHEDRLRQRQARVSVGSRIRASGSTRGVEYTVPVQNVGANAATGVIVDLVGEDGQSVGRGTLERALVAGESADVTVFTPPPDPYTGPYTVFVEWTDGRGQNREASERRVGKPG